ncbi:phage holin [Staphylococcus massiliensis]|uniref:phage holin n=1 Tax=Staphylococcus massiliensis TaxID=555791 RepID=UPI001EE14C77|nr:phage holin [Staphylococcus massiliensis]MCG3400053.1 phage holin [Staphylococcus massiliensis]
MNKINWKVRLKRKSFWVAIISALALFVNNITGAFGVDYSQQVEQSVDIASSVLTLLAGLGVIIDPTTKGVKDSAIVQTYEHPRDDKNPHDQVTYIKNDGGNEHE